MRRSLVIAAAVLSVVLVVGLLGCSGQQGSSGGGGYGSGSSGSGSTGSSGSGSKAGAVTMENFSFSPDSVTIKAGESVTWTNNDSTAHTVTGDDGLDSGDIAPGASYSKKFAKTGTYSYHCSIHPSMTGTIIVK